MFREEKENKNKFKNKKLEKCANLLDNKTEVSELKVSQVKKCGWTILPVLEEIVKKNNFFSFRSKYTNQPSKFMQLSFLTHSILNEYFVRDINSPIYFHQSTNISINEIWCL